MSLIPLESITNSARKAKKIGSIIFHPIVPPDLIFFITSRCNAGCHFCLFHEQVHDKERKNSEMTLDEIEQFAKNYGSLTKLSLSGGEPFIRRDIAHIIRLFDTYTKPAIIDVPTNGYFVDRIGRHVREMLDYTEKNQPVLEIQLSIDGPREIHDKVRKVPGIFDKVLETYWVLDEIRKENPRLRIKMNLTYVVENEDAVLQLTEEFDKKYNFDRYQITFPHGAKADENIIPKLEYEKYLLQSNEILKHTKAAREGDLHSLVFRAVKIIKDEVLLDVIRQGDMGAKCKAGRRILVVDERGKVYPCEPLWKSIGDLRETNYEIMPILKGDGYKAFSQCYLGKGKCNCTWGNVLLDSIVFDPRYFPKIIKNMIMLSMAGGKGINTSPSVYVKEILSRPKDELTSVPDFNEVYSIKAKKDAERAKIKARRFNIVSDSSDISPS
jgi:MoaA/NifB/PqqE/SkfB family radical SAM enzyme